MNEIGPASLPRHNSSEADPGWPDMQIILRIINCHTKKQLMVMLLVSCFFLWSVSHNLVWPVNDFNGTLYCHPMFFMFFLQFFFDKQLSISYLHCSDWFKSFERFLLGKKDAVALTYGTNCSENCFYFGIARTFTCIQVWYSGSNSPFIEKFFQFREHNVSYMMWFCEGRTTILSYTERYFQKVFRFWHCSTNVVLFSNTVSVNARTFTSNI